jgi:hypothetical protein
VQNPTFLVAKLDARCSNMASFCLINFFLSSDVKDIHDCLEISVYDEDKRGAPDLLGKVAIPLLQVNYNQLHFVFLFNRFPSCHSCFFVR